MPENCTCTSSYTTINESGSSSQDTSLGFWLSIGYNIISTVVAAGLAVVISRSKSSATHSIESSNTEVTNADGSTRVERTVKATVAANTETSTTEFKLNPSKAGTPTKTDAGVAAATPADTAGMPKTPALKREAIGMTLRFAQATTNGQTEEERAGALEKLAGIVADPANAAAASKFQGAARRLSQVDNPYSPHSPHDKHFHEVAKHVVEAQRVAHVFQGIKAGVDHTPHPASSAAHAAIGAAKEEGAHTAASPEHVSLHIIVPHEERKEEAPTPHHAKAPRNSMLDGAGALLRVAATPLAEAAAHAIEGMPFGQAAGAMMTAAAKAVSGTASQAGSVAHAATSGVAEETSHAVSGLAHEAEAVAHTGLTEAEEVASAAREQIGVVGGHLDL